MRRILVVATAVVALVLGVSVSAQAAGPDAHSIIMAKTGADATQVASPQSVGGLTIGTGSDGTGTALDSYAQRTATSVRMMATITDPSQTKVDFTLGLPVGAGVVSAADGSLTISREKAAPNAAGTSVVEQFGTIAKPWASDAKGKALTTSYSYADGVLTQNIDTAGATFPVVADPWVTSGLYLYVHFSRAETINLYRAWKTSGTPNEVTYLCGLMLLIPVIGVIMVGLCSFYITRVIADINVTVNYCNAAFHRRLVIKLLPVGPFYYMGSYSEYSP